MKILLSIIFMSKVVEDNTYPYVDRHVPDKSQTEWPE